MTTSFDYSTRPPTSRRESKVPVAVQTRSFGPETALAALRLYASSKGYRLDTRDDALIVASVRYRDGEPSLVWSIRGEDSQLQLMLVDNTGTIVTTWHGQGRHNFWQAYRPGLKSWRVVITSQSVEYRRLV